MLTTRRKGMAPIPPTFMETLKPTPVPTLSGQPTFVPTFPNPPTLEYPTPFPTVPIPTFFPTTRFPTPDPTVQPTGKTNHPLRLAPPTPPTPLPHRNQRLNRTPNPTDQPTQKPTPEAHNP